MNQRQLQMIDYLREENRILREQLGERRMRLNDDQRRRLAAKAKGLGRKLLAEVATIVTPETLLAVSVRESPASDKSGDLICAVALPGCARQGASCAAAPDHMCLMHLDPQAFQS
jgi:hypothetical protein